MPFFALNKTYPKQERARKLLRHPACLTAIQPPPDGCYMDQKFGAITTSSKEYHEI